MTVDVMTVVTLGVLRCTIYDDVSITSFIQLHIITLDSTLIEEYDSWVVVGLTWVVGNKRWVVSPEPSWVNR